MNKRKPRDPRAVARVEAMFARFRAVEHDPAALEALMEDSLAELDADLDRARKKMDETRKKRGAFTNDAVKLTEMVEQLGQLADPREQSRMRAAAIERWIKARSAKLKQCGDRAPVREARKEAAERYGHKNGPALNRWIRRHR